jgi:hypothetical protein
VASPLLRRLLGSLLAELRSLDGSRGAAARRSLEQVSMSNY